MKIINVSLSKISIMKKLIFLLFVLHSTIFFSQNKKTPKSNDLDKEVNISLDSISRIYGKKVVNCFTYNVNGRKKIFISYYENEKFIRKLISDKPINN